ncbi:MAG: trypsin-like peptidase domain-containing protein [bacterium]|nr:trypsin-like peptidase domain-containing protein [bacterium]
MTQTRVFGLATTYFGWLPSSRGQAGRMIARCSQLALLWSLISASALTAGEISARRNTRTVQAIRQAEPAVVNIEGNKPSSSVTGAGSDGQQVNGMGAGIIIDSRGYILTNQHVIQDVTRIEVTLHNGRQYVGKLIARHTETDLAMIKIDARQPLPVIRCGTSSDLMLGEPVIAIGNPFGYHHTVTEGIISALHRDIPVNGVQDYPDLIQTDASINPGNSGGPLLNADGDMIGINAAVRIGAQGIGFAIPVDRAVEVAADMIAEHRRSIGSTELQVKTSYKDSLSFVTVERAQNEEIRPGDVIKSVSGIPVANRLHYELALIGHRSGSSVELEIERDKEIKLAKLTLEDSSTPQIQLTSAGSLQSQVYNLLGLQLEPASASQVQRIDSTYKCGLKVRYIRKNSPAALAQIRSGDILVGLLDWQTPNWDDLSWILKSNEMKTASTAKFHIIRGNDVFWGTLDLRRARVQ